MKILHIALLSPTEPNQAPSRAMKDNGHEVIVIDWVKIMKRAGVGNLRSTIINEAKNFHPDIVFMQIQTDGIIDIETATILSSIGFVVNWTGDVRTNIDWYKQLAPHVDLTLFSNLTDVKTLQSEGLRSEYLQVGYDEDLYCLGRSHKTNFADIVFLGNNYKSSPINFPLTGERIAMVDYMSTRFKGKFKAYGSGWKGSQRLQINDEINCYRFSKIAINQNHFNYEKFSSDRIFRAMGCGIFMASRYYKGIEDEFEMGKHLECWSTLQELEDICRYYLANDKARKKIALEGAKHVRENHTWHNRFKELVLIKEKYEQSKLGITN
jgi:spore maturation protein CgeB